MQHQIRWACSHTTTVNIYGTNTHGERERKADSLAKLPCPACRQSAERDALAARAAELPALTGSERQIKWATTLRDQALAEAKEWGEEHENKLSDAGREQLHRLIDAAQRQTDAAWWIDTRAQLWHARFRALLDPTN